ncbi:MAG: sulfotransferase [Halioglobus sp.]
MSPQISAVHPLGTHEVEEELGLLQHSFSSQIFEVTARLPSFAEWLMTHDQTYAYEYMTVLMKIICWFRNDPEGQTWVLKTPQHMQDLDALINVFPNAKLVCSHRDPIKVIGSLSSMTWNSIVRDSNHLTPEWIGPEWLNKSELMLKKTIYIRQTRVPASNQCDIQYADITADWEQAMRGIYDFIGMPFSSVARNGMQAWLDSNSQHKHGAHKYSLENFGVTAPQVDQQLMFYRERYSIPYETKNPHLDSA